MLDLATAAFVGKREDALFVGPGGTGKSHMAQAIGPAAILQGYRVLYRETHVLLDELADAVAGGTRKLPTLLPRICWKSSRRYERFSTLLTSNRPVEDWGKLLGDVAAISAMLDRWLHHGHVSL